ncbi:MAG: hypothetical protein ACKOZX_02535, partial [Gammaproteobacteria bacterium]
MTSGRAGNTPRARVQKAALLATGLAMFALWPAPGAYTNSPPAAADREAQEIPSPPLPSDPKDAETLAHFQALVRM